VEGISKESSSNEVTWKEENVVIRPVVARDLQLLIPWDVL
jgi:hypothetical protein